MSEEKPAREPIGEDARIDALEERLKAAREREEERNQPKVCLLYTSPSPRDLSTSRMPSSA